MTEIRVKRLGVMDKTHSTQSSTKMAKVKQMITEEAKIIPKSFFFFERRLKTLTNTKDDAQNHL